MTSITSQQSARACCRGQIARIRACRLRGFTLVELMVVLAIMTMVMGIAMASFSNMTRSVSTTGAARSVMAALRLARQYAVARRVSVAFIVCDTQFANDYPSAVAGKYAHLAGRAFAIYDIRNNEYLQGWTLLPKNTFFLPGKRNDLESRIGVRLPLSHGENAIFGSRAVSAERGSVVSTTIPFPTAYSPNQCSFFGIVFQPNGQLMKSSDNWYQWFVLAECIQAGDGSLAFRTNSHATHGIELTPAGGVRYHEGI